MHGAALDILEDSGHGICGHRACPGVHDFGHKSHELLIGGMRLLQVQNGRGFSNPRVAGGQLGNGAMGNARWKGVPLKTILDKAGMQEGAKQVTFNGADTPAAETTPDFIKALE